MESITKEFPGVKALSNVSIKVGECEVLGLLGENGAGKSTMVNILGGVLKKDSGTIVIDGKEVDFKNPIDAQKTGVAFIHQELSLFTHLSVAENIFINSFDPLKGFPIIYDKKTLTDKTKAILEMLSAKIKPSTIVRNLTMGQRQLVEIARAVSLNAKIIIFDEPTSSLADTERQKILDVIRMLRAQGKAIIYISHDIEEAINITDNVAVLRDGEYVGKISTQGVEGEQVEEVKNQIIKMMVGTSIESMFTKTSVVKGDVVMSVSNMTRDGYVNNVSFELRQREILGFYGLIGAGRSELARMIFGMDRASTGEVYVDGVRVKKPSPRVMKKLRVGFLSENRREEGLILPMSVRENITITDLGKFVKGLIGRIHYNKEKDLANKMVDSLRIITPSINQVVAKLSGGNQQKVVVAKWLHLKPDIYILDEPTKGIDVGAKKEIYKLIVDLANQGASVILISSEIEEILGMSDRIIVMRDGFIAGEFDNIGEPVVEERLLACAIG